MKKILRLILVYVIIPLIVIEGILRIVGLPREYKPLVWPLQLQNSLDREIGYTSLRSSSIDFVYDGNPRGYFRQKNTVEHITNSAGYRGPEILLKKPINTERFLFLGDSWTFGLGVYFEDSYPNQFKVFGEQRELFNKHIEAINLGVGGYNTAQEYATLEKAQDLKPDEVIVGYCLNDARSPIYDNTGEEIDFTYIWDELEKEIYDLATKEKDAFSKFSRIYRILEKWRASKVITQKTLEYYHSLYEDDNVSWLKTKEAIKNFGEYQKATKTPVVFVIFPVLFEVNDYPFAAEHQKIKDELDHNGIKYVDVTPFLAGYGGPELWVHPTDQHPNEIVHKIAAEALVEKFRNK